MKPSRAALLACLTPVLLLAGACTGSPSPPPYDGTWLADFHYEYQLVTRVDDRELPGSEVTGPWTAASVAVTLNLRTVSTAGGWASLAVENLSIRDPGFGAFDGPAVGPVSPLPSSASLPVPPGRALSSGEGPSLMLAFANGSSLTSSPASSNGVFSASADGRSLSFAVTFAGPTDYSPGAFTGSAPSGPFAPLREQSEYFVRGMYWAMVKEGN